MTMPQYAGCFDAPQDERAKPWNERTMVDAEVVARRVLSLNETLTHLARPGANDAQRLRADPLLRAAVERWLQLCIEACIDMAYHIVADGGWTPPDTARGAFGTLAAHDIIPAELADRLGKSAAMRNVLVHDYVAVDLERIALAVREDLDDLRAFGAVAAKLIEQG